RFHWSKWTQAFRNAGSPNQAPQGSGKPQATRFTLARKRWVRVFVQHRRIVTAATAAVFCALAGLGAQQSQPVVKSPAPGASADNWTRMKECTEQPDVSTVLRADFLSELQGSIALLRALGRV